MFGIGMNEILLLTVLALVIIGPKRLPEVARGLGKLLSQFKRATNDLRTAVNEEMNAHPELRDLQEIRDELSGSVRAVTEQTRSYVQEEMDAETDLAESVKREMRDVAMGIKKTVDDAADEEGGSADGADAGPTGAGTRLSYVKAVKQMKPPTQMAQPAIDMEESGKEEAQPAAETANAPEENPDAEEVGGDETQGDGEAAVAETGKADGEKQSASGGKA